MKAAFLVFLAVFFAYSGCGSTCGQSMPLTESRANSSNWHDRSEAFQSLVSSLDRVRGSSSEEETVHASLIRLLRKESASPGSESDGNTEAYSEYYASLISTVASLKDPQALDALMDENVLTSGDMAVRGIAELGEPASTRIVRAFGQTSSALPRIALSQIASRMLVDRKVVDQVERSSLRSLLISASADADPYVRISSFEGLECFHDQQTRKLLQNIAESDSFTITRKGAIEFPVRLEASRALRTLVQTHTVE